MQKSNSTFSLIVLILFFFSIAAGIAYSSLKPKLSCADKGGVLVLVGYKRPYNGFSYSYSLYPKYKCMIAKHE